jgi:hypothetical protein
VRIVTRQQWGAKPPKTRPVPLKLPVSELFIHHTVTAITPDRLADVRTVQDIAFSRKFNDISYNYLIDLDGNVYEGRGLNVGAHLEGRNSKSFGVALIGDYTRRVVTDAQVDSVRQLVAWLIGQGALRPGPYPTGGHRDAPDAATACPGEFAMRRLAEMRAPWIGIPDPPKEVRPMFDPPIQVAAWCLVDYDGGGLVAVTPTGDVYCEPPSLYKGAPGGKDYWGNRRAARIEPFEDRYRIISVSGEAYADF